MIRILLFTVIILAGAIRLHANEPTIVNLNTNGTINWLYYDLTNESELAPLTGIYLTGQGHVQKIRLDYQGSRFLIDQYGYPEGVVYGPFEVELDADGKLEEFEKNFTTLLRFDYDFDGRLEEVKDGNFNTLFELDYNMDGSLDHIDKGGFNMFARFYYNLDDQLDGIKDDNYNYIWDIDYNFDNEIDEIEDRNYKTRVKFQYNTHQLYAVSTYQTTTQFVIGPVYVDYLNGWVQNGGQNNTNCGNGNTNGNPQYGAAVQFFKHAHFQGPTVSYTPGDLVQLPHDWNDQISSIILPPGYILIVYEHANFGGAAKVILSNWTVPGSLDYWNDRITSFRMVKI